MRPPMSEPEPHPPTEPPPAGPPAPDEPLARIVDDADDLGDATEWAAKELVRGRSFDAVAADLTAGGWGPGAAADIVESARQQTRAERGVVTRDAVAYRAERRYRTTLANTRWIAFGGLPGAIGIVRNLVILLRSMWSSQRTAEPPAAADHLPAGPSDGKPPPPRDRS
jgi:hypothetical protein